VISISELFLETANGLLAPAIGRRHSFREFLLKKTAGTRVKLEDYVLGESSPEVYDSWLLADTRLRTTGGKIAPLPAAELNAFDLLFCDSVSYSLVKHKRAVRYRLVSNESLADVANLAGTMLRLVPSQRHTSA
jgi:hypothetical protein